MVLLDEPTRYLQSVQNTLATLRLFLNTERKETAEKCFLINSVRVFSDIHRHRTLRLGRGLEDVS